MGSKYPKNPRKEKIMFDKLTIAKALAKAAVSRLPEGSKARKVFSRLETIKPEELGVAGKELLVMGAGKGRSLVAELAQKTADALSEGVQTDEASPKPVFSGKVHELTVWNDSHEVSIEDEVIVVTSTDGREQTRINLKASSGAVRDLQHAVSTRIHDILMGKEPK